jgi:hypothetical protein
VEALQLSRDAPEVLLTVLQLAAELTIAGPQKFKTQLRSESAGWRAAHRPNLQIDEDSREDPPNANRDQYLRIAREEIFGLLSHAFHEDKLKIAQDSERHRDQRRDEELGVVSEH